MIAIIFDIDGVITDGTIIVDQNNNESKRMNLKDVDAINEIAQSGFFIGAVTTEKNSFTDYIRNKFHWNVFFDGSTNKTSSLMEIRALGCEKIVYIGDGKKDLCAAEYADVFICPSDAISELKEKADIVLNSRAGGGGLWEVVDYLRRDDAVKHTTAEIIWKTTLEEHNSLLHRLIEDKVYREKAITAAEIITNALAHNKRVVIFGNGGSAADAQHIAAEYIGRFQSERASLDMEALTVNSSIITAISNDYCYDLVFARQLEAMIRHGDVAIGITTSGHSKNVRLALDEAQRRGCKTILLTGQMAEVTPYDVTLRVPSTVTARIQEVHITTGHFWAEYSEKVLLQSMNNK